MTRAALAVCLVTMTAGLEAGPRQAPAPANPASGTLPQPPRARAALQVDEERARRLYVSNKPGEHAVNSDFDADVKQRTETEARYAQASRGVMDFTKVTYRSSVGDQQNVDALRSRKPDLAETRVYVNPTPGPVSVGHTFNRRTNLKTLERDDSPEQRDSWNRVRTFFDWHLRPYAERPLPKGSAAR